MNSVRNFVMQLLFVLFPPFRSHEARGNYSFKFSFFLFVCFVGLFSLRLSRNPLQEYN